MDELSIFVVVMLLCQTCLTARAVATFSRMMNRRSGWQDSLGIRYSQPAGARGPRSLDLVICHLSFVHVEQSSTYCSWKHISCTDLYGRYPISTVVYPVVYMVLHPR